MTHRHSWIPPSVESTDIPVMEYQDPKVSLLRQKLALVAGKRHCPIYDNIREQHPNALQEPWATAMGTSFKFVGRVAIFRRFKCSTLRKKARLHIER